MNCKFFIGPMTKNVVDSVIQFSNNFSQEICLIPSRRQVEINGGYVNNWSTKDFSEYVKSRSNKVFLMRDHGGPGQGDSKDDGLDSLAEDCNYMDSIHIDPWKEYPTLEEGTRKTSELIKFCYSRNPNLFFEVGTEESIRKFSPPELERVIIGLKELLSEEEFRSIRYLVIQSGTSLKGNLQSGEYSESRLRDMIEISNKFKMISKEHNGDYIPEKTIFEKFDIGLDCINIAPEFGLIETETYLDYLIKNWNFSGIEKFWKICLESKRWVKWVNESFDPVQNKKELIKICGHYVVSDPEFNSISSSFPGIDDEIIKRISCKIGKLHGYKAKNNNL
jgi:hypothetical protein